MAKLTRSGLVYGVMNANATLPMEEVLQLIVDADAVSGLPGKCCDLKRAKAYYVDAVKKGLANGVGPTKTARAPRSAAPKDSSKDSSKAEKAPKAPKLIKPKLDVSGIADRKPVTDKTVEEIADIKAKNLARLRAVGRKHYANQADGREGGFSKKEAKEARDYVSAVTNDLDSFKVPEFLSMSEVKALV